MDVKKISEMVQFQAEKMRKVNLFESERMFCDLYCLEAGQEQVVHIHESNDKVYYVLEGRGRFTIGGESRLLGVGEIACAWSGQPHGVENCSDQRLTCLVYMAPHPKPEKFHQKEERR